MSLPPLPHEPRRRTGRTFVDPMVRIEGITLFWYDPIEYDIPEESTRQFNAKWARELVGETAVQQEVSEPGVDLSPASPTEPQSLNHWPTIIHPSLDQHLLYLGHYHSEGGSGVQVDHGEAYLRTLPANLELTSVSDSHQYSGDLTSDASWALSLDTTSRRFPSVCHDRPLHPSYKDDNQRHASTVGALPHGRKKDTFALPAAPHITSTERLASSSLDDLSQIRTPVSVATRPSYDTKTGRIVSPGDIVAAKSTRASSGETRSSIDTNGTPIARAPPAGPHFVPHIQDSDYEKLLSRASSRTFRGHGSPLSFYVVSDRWKNATIDYIRRHGGGTAPLQKAQYIVFRRSDYLTDYEEDAFLYMKHDQIPITLPWLLHSVEIGTLRPYEIYLVDPPRHRQSDRPQTTIPFSRNWGDESGRTWEAYRETRIPKPGSSAPPALDRVLHRASGMGATRTRESCSQPRDCRAAPSLAPSGPRLNPMPYPSPVSPSMDTGPLLKSILKRKPSGSPSKDSADPPTEPIESKGEVAAEAHRAGSSSARQIQWSVTMASPTITSTASDVRSLSVPPAIDCALRSVGTTDTSQTRRHTGKRRTYFAIKTESKKKFKLSANESQATDGTRSAPVNIPAGSPVHRIPIDLEDIFDGELSPLPNEPNDASTEDVDLDETSNSISDGQSWCAAEGTIFQPSKL